MKAGRRIEIGRSYPLKDAAGAHGDLQARKMRVKHPDPVSEGVEVRRGLPFMDRRHRRSFSIFFLRNMLMAENTRVGKEAEIFGERET